MHTASYEGLDMDFSRAWEQVWPDALHGATNDLYCRSSCGNPFRTTNLEWNGLPHELRQCNTLPCFKSHLKT